MVPDFGVGDSQFGIAKTPFSVPSKALNADYGIVATSPDEGNPSNEQDEQDSSNNQETKTTEESDVSIKDAIHERDRYRCLNCLATDETAELLDLDHNVPRGVGGGDPFSNLGTLCRRCHDAKHGEGIAPTIRFASTGTMTNVEFSWFKHFVQEMIPALFRLADGRVQPKFDIEGHDEWCLPLGDVRRLDESLAQKDSDYLGAKTHHYM